MVIQAGDGAAGQLGSSAGGDGDFKPQSPRVVDQDVDVLAAERIAASENQVWQRSAEVGELIEE